MTTPIRLRLSRLKNFNLQALSMATNGLPAVNVARPSKWGNPFKVGAEPKPLNDLTLRRRPKPVTPQEAVDLFRRRECAPYRAAEFVRALRGKNLACWCALDQPCHADVLLEIANRPICEAV